MLSSNVGVLSLNTPGYGSSGPGSIGTTRPALGPSSATLARELASLEEMQQSREDDLKQMLDVQTELNSAQARISFLEGNKTVTVDNIDAQPAPVIKAAVATP